MSVPGRPSGEPVAVGADISPTSAWEVVAAGRAVLLDVREPGEWRAGHAPQARHVPLGRLTGATGEIGDGPGVRDTVLVVCRSGHRSAVAAERLARAGVTARNVTGGMAAWARAGLPVVGDGGTPGTVA